MSYENLSILRHCEAMLIILSPDYINALKDPEDDEHIKLTEQVITAKEECMPFVLLMCEGVSQEDLKYMREYIGKHLIKKEILFPQSEEEMDSLAKALKEI